MLSIFKDENLFLDSFLSGAASACTYVFFGALAIWILSVSRIRLNNNFIPV
jgi:hypothetical protein